MELWSGIARVSERPKMRFYALFSGVWTVLWAGLSVLSNLVRKNGKFFKTWLVPKPAKVELGKTLLVLANWLVPGHHPLSPGLPLPLDVFDSAGRFPNSCPVSELPWFVAHTKPRREKKLVEFCERQGFAVTLPCYNSAHKYRGKTVVFR